MVYCCTSGNHIIHPYGYICCRLVRARAGELYRRHILTSHQNIHCACPILQIQVNRMNSHNLAYKQSAISSAKMYNIYLRSFTLLTHIKICQYKRKKLEYFTLDCPQFNKLHLVLALSDIKLYFHLCLTRALFPQHLYKREHITSLYKKYSKTVDLNRKTLAYTTKQIAGG